MCHCRRTRVNRMGLTAVGREIDKDGRSIGQVIRLVEGKENGGSARWEEKVGRRNRQTWTGSVPRSRTKRRSSLPVAGAGFYQHRLHAHDHDPRLLTGLVQPVEPRFGL